MDFIEGLPQSGSANCILVVADKFTELAHFLPLEHSYTVVVDQNPPTGVDMQHESQETRSLYPSALQLARDLMLRFVGYAA
jgi:hypothetical protein